MACATACIEPEHAGGELRALAGFVLIQDGRAGNIRRHQVRGKLDALERDVQDLADSAGDKFAHDTLDELAVLPDRQLDHRGGRQRVTGHIPVLLDVARAPHQEVVHPGDAWLREIRAVDGPLGRRDLLWCCR